MAKTRSLRFVDASFLADAPVTASARQTLPASAAEAFRALEDGDAWPVWLVPVDKIDWTSTQPFGVGTTRNITGKGAVTSEYFFAWEDGHRMAFNFTESQLPFFAAFAEDYELIDEGADQCTLVWSWGFECRGPFKYAQPIVGLGFKKTAQKSLKNLATYMAENRTKYVE